MSQPTRILLALAIGIGLGMLSAAFAGAGFNDASLAVAETVGGMWLDGLRMTIVPLVVALLVTGIAAGAEAARAGGLALRALIIFIACLWTSSVIAALLVPALTSIWPIPAESAAALRDALGATNTAIGEVPPISSFIRSIVPTNPVAAAANDAILPLILFTGVFAFAVTRLPAEPRATLTGFFAALADAMLIVIGWLLWIAPAGVLALAYVVGARAGLGAVGALIHYILIVSAAGAVVWALCYPLAVIGGRVKLGAFARAVAPPQALAISSQSSLACLPLMLKSAERLGVPVSAAGVVLPMAVALFRITGPVMNLAVALYIAHWFGIELTLPQMAVGVAAAALTTMGAVGLPGQVTFITSIAPICIAMGLPIEPLALLLAVETMPDIVRTLGNVTADVAVTTMAARGEPETAADAGLREAFDRQDAG